MPDEGNFQTADTVVFPTAVHTRTANRFEAVTADVSFCVNISKIACKTPMQFVSTSGCIFPYKKEVCSPLCASDIFWARCRSAFGSPRYTVFVSSTSEAVTPAPPMFCVWSVKKPDTRSSSWMPSRVWLRHSSD